MSGSLQIPLALMWVSERTSAGSPLLPAAKKSPANGEPAEASWSKLRAGGCEFGSGIPVLRLRRRQKQICRGIYRFDPMACHGGDGHRGVARGLAAQTQARVRFLVLSVQQRAVGGLGSARRSLCAHCPPGRPCSAQHTRRREERPGFSSLKLLRKFSPQRRKGAEGTQRKAYKEEEQWRCRRWRPIAHLSACYLFSSAVFLRFLCAFAPPR